MRKTVLSLANLVNQALHLTQGIGVYFFTSKIAKIHESSEENSTSKSKK
jgi:hypothetical protein